MTTFTVPTTLFLFHQFSLQHFTVPSLLLFPSSRHFPVRFFFVLFGNRTFYYHHVSTISCTGKEIAMHFSPSLGFHITQFLKVDRSTTIRGHGDHDYNFGNCQSTRYLSIDAEIYCRKSKSCHSSHMSFLSTSNVWTSRTDFRGTLSTKVTTRLTNILSSSETDIRGEDSAKPELSCGLSVQLCARCCWPTIRNDGLSCDSSV